MRTAVIYSTFKEMKETDQRGFERLFLNKVSEKIDFIRRKQRERRINLQQAKRDFSKDRRDIRRDIERELTQYFDFEQLRKRDGSYKYDPHSDIFRCLKVSDALPVKSQYRIYDFRVLDKQNNGDLVFESPIFAEALSPGAVFEFQATWDSWLAERFKELNEIPVNGLDDVLKACKTFTDDQVAWETEFFKSCRNGAEDPGKIVSSLAGMDADLRLGWGSGLTGASLSMLLPLDLRMELRDVFFQRHAQGVREFPKSRRVLVERNQPVSLLGFCRLEPQR